MIDQETIKRLGSALADLHRQYSEEDLGQILDYAFRHRAITGFGSELAEKLEAIAIKLRAAELAARLKKQ